MDELLQILAKGEAHAPEDLARMLGVSEAEIIRKIAEYRKNGVVRGFLAILDEGRCQDGRVRAVIEIKCTPQREGGFDRLARRIAGFPEVRSIFLMSGTYDLLALVEGDSLRQVAWFVAERLATMEGVISTATHFVLRAYKEHGVLMEPEKPDERLKVSP